MTICCFTAANGGINGVIKIDANFDIIDNKERFKRYMPRNTSLLLYLFLCQFLHIFQLFIIVSSNFVKVCRHC